MQLAGVESCIRERVEAHTSMQGLPTAYAPMAYTITPIDPDMQAQVQGSHVATWSCIPAEGVMTMLPQAFGTAGVHAGLQQGDGTGLPTATFTLGPPTGHSDPLDKFFRDIDGHQAEQNIQTGKADVGEDELLVRTIDSDTQEAFGMGSAIPVRAAAPSPSPYGQPLVLVEQAIPANITMQHNATVMHAAQAGQNVSSPNNSEASTYATEVRMVPPSDPPVMRFVSAPMYLPTAHPMTDIHGNTTYAMTSGYQYQQPTMVIGPDGQPMQVQFVSASHEQPAPTLYSMPAGQPVHVFSAASAPMSLTTAAGPTSQAIETITDVSGNQWVTATHISTEGQTGVLPTMAHVTTTPNMVVDQDGKLMQVVDVPPTLLASSVTNKFMLQPLSPTNELPVTTDSPFHEQQQQQQQQQQRELQLPQPSYPASRLAAASANTQYCIQNVIGPDGVATATAVPIQLTSVQPSQHYTMEFAGGFHPQKQQPREARPEQVVATTTQQFAQSPPVHRHASMHASSDRSQPGPPTKAGMPRPSQEDIVQRSAIIYPRRADTASAGRIANATVQSALAATAAAGTATSKTAITVASLAGNPATGVNETVGAAWAAMEAVYGPAMKCGSGACEAFYDQPCDDHRCSCCKLGRRVIQYEKQGFCGPCGRREIVHGLRFIRCGMCKAEMVERAYEAHLKQYVIMPDATGKKVPVKCKEHMATCPKVNLPTTAGKRCSKCNNMRPLSYYLSEESTCNWHIAQRLPQSAQQGPVVGQKRERGT